MKSLRKIKSLIFFELFQYLISPGFYILFGGFFVLLGLIFIVGLDSSARIAPNELLMTQIFKCIWIPCLFIVPILTLRKIILEKQNGQLKQFLTIPIQKYQLVISKFISALLIFVLLWSQVVILPFIAKIFIKSINYTDIVPNFSFIFMLPFEGLLIGSFTIAVGVLCGYFFESFISAYAMYFVCIFIYFMVGSLLKHISLLTVQYAEKCEVLSYKFNIFYTMEDLSCGIIDFKVMIFYLSLTFIILTCASMVVRVNK